MNGSVLRCVGVCLGFFVVCVGEWLVGCVSGCVCVSVDV